MTEEKRLQKVKGRKAYPNSDRSFDPVHAKALVQTFDESLSLVHKLSSAPHVPVLWRWRIVKSCSLHAPANYV